MSKDWGEEHARKHDELLGKYQVYGALVPETKFKIMECLTGGSLARSTQNTGLLAWWRGSCSGPGLQRGYSAAGARRGRLRLARAERSPCTYALVV